MLKLDARFSKYVLSHCKIAAREYDFILKSIPGEPWILRIKAVKQAGDKRYRGICSLMVRRSKDEKYSHPSMKAEHPDQAILLTLTLFLIGEIAEIAENKSYEKI